MIKVGVTGGIGGGKSTVCRLFKLLGIPIFNADDIAKSIMQVDAELIDQIKGLFGIQIYKEGILDRALLGQIVFNDKNKLQKLNDLVHPAVENAFKKWLNLHLQSKYIIKEAAITFEINAQDKMDKMILVTADEEIRIKRVIKRNGITAEEVKSRMKNQWTDLKKMPLSHFIIINDGKQSLIKQVIDIHHVLLKISG